MGLEADMDFPLQSAPLIFGRYFPYDTHVCNISVGSWSYPPSEVDVGPGLYANGILWVINRKLTPITCTNYFMTGKTASLAKNNLPGEVKVDLGNCWFSEK